MILLVDADSLVFSSCYRKRSEFFTDIEQAKAKFDEVFLSMLNDIEEIYDLDDVKVFNGARGNFRKFITPKYKANRTDMERPPLLNDMHYYVSKTYDAINACGVETDDVVARYWYEISQAIGRDQVMIVSLDKDITPEQARYNFYEQMIAGDTADNVNYFKGKGVKFAKDYYNGCVTDYQYRRKLYELFKKEYKSKAKEKYSECYNLLKLRTK